jgi:hypothetical protein
VVRLSADAALAGLALAASSLYYAYLYENAGVPTIEVVTTAPAAPYNGTARTKTGDTGRRYIGAFATDSGGAIVDFDHHPQSGRVLFLVNVGAGVFKIITSGTATSDTNVSVASLVPVSARFACIEFENTNTSGTVLITTPGGTGVTVAFVRGSGLSACEVPLLSARAVSYYVQGGAASIYLRGYIDER